MTIRFATEADLDQVKDILEFGYRFTPYYGKQEIDWLHMQRMLAVAVVMPNFYFIVNEHKGALVGALCGLMDVNVWGHKIGAVIACYSKRDTPKMYRQFEQWAAERGATRSLTTEESKNDRFVKLLNRSGYGEHGIIYSKVI